jgi:broad specificity phosphatase PhoE
VIVVVRHGRTGANAQGLLLGRADPPLDAEGVRQSAALAGACAGLDVVRVVTSPLARCRATAEAVAGDRPVVVAVDERWFALDYGELDGRAWGDLPPGTWERWRADINWAPPGGESLAALGARVREGCTELAEEARDRDVVVVSHVSPIKAAVAWALGIGDEAVWRMWVGPGSITRIGWGGSGPSLRSFNELGHLG